MKNRYLTLLGLLTILNIVQSFAQTHTMTDDGLVVFEAEDYSAYKAGDTVNNGAWIKESGSSEFSTSTDFMGDSYMRSYMDSGENYDTNNAQLTYTVNFKSAGTYTIWERVNNAKIPGDGDSYYIHVDGKMLTDNMIIYDRTFKISDKWLWLNQTFTINEAGEHSIVVTQRESGLIIDQLAITNDDAFDPIAYNEITLANLSVTGYQMMPYFDGMVTSYTINLPKGIDSIEILAEPSKQEDTVTGTGTIELTGENEIKEVVVNRASGLRSKTYKIAIKYIDTEKTLYRQMEKLDRGIVAIYSSGTAFVSWRIFGNDPIDIAFNLYRSENGVDVVKLNEEPLEYLSNFADTSVNMANQYEYFIKPVINGEEGEASKSFLLDNENPYLSISLDKPADGIAKNGEKYDYHANDATVADLDGDGQYEVIVKWQPSNATDNKPGKFTGNTIIDAYTMEGRQLWRIDLGHNIRSGPHYNPFIVYDFDGDGKAELAVKTAPATKDASGEYISTGPAASADHLADYRDEWGMILTGPEYLTLFDGWFGTEIQTILYIPQRGNVSDWGDSYGNRVDRFLAGVAYLDGERPSLIMARGYYAKTVVAAFDYRDGELSTRWVFNTDDNYETYKGQGNHSLSVADVDFDGKDEIIYGAMALDNDGTGLYSTGLGHGDALHVGDLDPDRNGLEVFSPHESGNNGMTFRDAATGEILWQYTFDGDNGRGVAFDIDPTHKGTECWSSDGRGVFDTKGNLITETYPVTAGDGWNYNMAAWWDGDLQRELVDRTVINKWNYLTNGTNRVLTAYNYEITSNNSTKSTPCLIADILGDWREEIIYRRSDNTALYILCNTTETQYGFYTLMHDTQYREAIAWQNVGYNQPAHPSFFIGKGMDTPPVPNIYLASSVVYSNDATLINLEVNGYSLKPTFNNSTKIYYVAIPSNSESVNINAIPTCDKATVIGNGEVTIETLPTTKTIEVIAEDGTSNIFTIYFRGVTGIDKVLESNIQINVENMHVVINSVNINDEVSIYKMNGDLISREYADQTKLVQKVEAEGIYIIQVKGINGNLLTRKVFVN